MAKTIDIKFIKYINLLEKISGVRTKHCFIYNSFIVFVVPSNFVFRAIGLGGRNVKKLCQILEKKIKIIAEPKGIEDASEFIKAIVEPARFKGIKIEKKELIISAGGRQNKATLIGRNKTRLMELKDIVKSYFEKELKIV